MHVFQLFSNAWIPREKICMHRLLHFSGSENVSTKSLLEWPETRQSQGAKSWEYGG
jgi:hypothetical protein